MVGKKSHALPEQSTATLGGVGAQQIERQGREVMFLAYPVQCGAQVGRRIGQGTVQIEEDGVRHCARCA